MRRRTWMLLLLLAASPVWAKPKVKVRVTLNDGIGKDHMQDSLQKNGNPLAADDIGGHGTTIIYGRVFYMNVSVLSNDAAAVAKGNGQWCITGDAALERFTEYNGTLDGSTLEIEFPQPDGKIKKVKFDIFDHKWRNLAEFAP